MTYQEILDNIKSSITTIDGKLDLDKLANMIHLIQ
jgi:hypothetical protein